MLFAIKLIGYFLLWGLWSYSMHALAHSRWRRYNFIRYCHLKHHQYEYGESMWPPWHDYLFWFGNWRSSLDVYMTFTIPLICLTFCDPLYGVILLVFHYLYEVFFSRNVLDHNPNIRGWITQFIPIGQYHMLHHRSVRCNFAFYLTLWDHVFGTYSAVTTLQQEMELQRAAAKGFKLRRREESAP